MGKKLVKLVLAIAVGVALFQLGIHLADLARTQAPELLVALKKATGLPSSPETGSPAQTDVPSVDEAATSPTETSSTETIETATTAAQAPETQAETTSAEQAPAPATTAVAAKSDKSSAPIAAAPAPKPTVAYAKAAREKDRLAMAQAQAQTKSKPSSASRQGCFQLSFKHAATTGHGSLAACNRHRNSVPFAAGLGPLGVNPSSICVRVDGTPVKFERHGDQLVLGPGPGPASVITVRYCTAQVSCTEGCQPPKDSFLTAIGADDTGADLSGPAARWRPDAADEDLDVNAELGELAGKVEAKKGQAVFGGWNAQSAETPACGKKVAQISRNGEGL